jgi:hypothetical protein
MAAGNGLEVAPEIEIRRNAGLSALVGLTGSGLAIAYLWRAGHTGTFWDWALFATMAVVGVMQLSALVDARTPLLVADGLGVRIRLGREWRGLPWGALDQIVVEEPDSWLRDGRLVLSPRNLNTALEGLDSTANRQVTWLQRLYGAPLAVPLGLTTRTSTDDLVGDLTELAAGRTEVVVLGGRDLAVLDDGARPQVEETTEVLTPSRIDDSSFEPGPHDQPTDLLDPHPRRSRVMGGLGMLVSRVGQGQSHDVDSEAPSSLPALAPAARFDPVAPLRDIRRALRAEISRDQPTVLGNAAFKLDPADDESVRGLPEDRELRRSGNVDLILQTPGANVRPIATVGESVEPLIIDDFVTEPAFDPVIGPEIAATRTRVGLTIDELSDRTRIRPHVLECIEVDDFGPCGGDFYARGHLRTLARVLGLDVEPMLHEFDDRYAHAPINARRVFEAELATGMNGGMRATVGGPRWSLLVGAVLCLLMVWGVARFFTDPPQELAAPSGVVSDSAGLAANQKPITSPLTVTKTMTVTATRAAARVVIRDRTGRIIWSGHLAQGAHQKVAGLAPFVVKSTDAGAVDVQVMGHRLGAIGTTGTAGTKSFG